MSDQDQTRSYDDPARELGDDDLDQVAGGVIMPIDPNPEDPANPPIPHKPAPSPPPPLPVPPGFGEPVNS